jgi:hypothetical protein
MSSKFPRVAQLGSDVAAMNFRIDQFVEPDGQIVLRLSGRIGVRALDMLRQLLDREKATLAIDLKEVTLVGREVVVFLASCECRGVEFRNCPAYVREWIDREGPSG